jgi:hypothetical protein
MSFPNIGPLGTPKKKFPLKMSSQLKIIKHVKKPNIHESEKLKLMKKELHVYKLFTNSLRLSEYMFDEVKERKQSQE